MMPRRFSRAQAAVTRAELDLVTLRRRMREGLDPPERDDAFRAGELAAMAACFAVQAADRTSLTADAYVAQMWPLGSAMPLPATRRELLLCAAAHALAEIDRLDRAHAARREPARTPLPIPPPQDCPDTRRRGPAGGRGPDATVAAVARHLGPLA